jgi:hypothetical protein
LANEHRPCANTFGTVLYSVPLSASTAVVSFGKTHKHEPCRRASQPSNVSRTAVCSPAQQNDPFSCDTFGESVKSQAIHNHSFTTKFNLHQNTRLPPATAATLQGPSASPRLAKHNPLCPAARYLFSLGRGRMRRVEGIYHGGGRRAP